MSRLNSAFSFYAQKRKRIKEEAERTGQQRLAETTDEPASLSDATQDPVAVADIVADRLNVLPEDQIKEQVPTVPTDESETAVEESTISAPIERAELLGQVGEDVEPGISAANRADLAKSQMLGLPQEGGELYQDTTNLSNVQKQEKFLEQITDEAQFRMSLDDDGAKLFGELVDTALVEDYSRKQSSDDDEASIQLFSDILDFAGKSVQSNQTKFNIFGKTIDTSQAGKELMTDPHGFLKANSDMISYAIKGADKLKMLEDPQDINSNIRPEVGRAMLIATIMEISQRLNQQAGEVDKEPNQRQYDNALDRVNIGKAIGARIERLLYPSASVDPNKPYTGESEAFGYQYRLTEQERSLLGQTVAQGFADSPNFKFMESVFLKEPGESDKGKWSFRPDRNGDQQLYKIRRALKDVMGLNEYDRPVSLVPTTKEGRLRGEGAFSQKQITSQLLKNKLPPKVQLAVEKLSQVAHTVPPHKVLLATAMLNSENSFFKKIRKADTDYFNKKYNEFLKEYKAREKNDPSFTPQSLGYNNFEEAANRQTIDIMDRHREMRMNTLYDAMNRMDNSFYYGYTAINNSSRLMITQQELNYQADKLARFLVDGAKPVVFKKNSNAELEMGADGFMGVIARAVIPEAGKMTPERQVRVLLDDLNNPNGSEYLKYGKELLAFTEANKGVIAKLRQYKINKKKQNQELRDEEKAIKEQRYIAAVQGAETDQDLFSAFTDAIDPDSPMNQVPGQKPQISPDNVNKEFAEGPIQLSEGLTEYFEKMGKDEFYFAMDALHELARWDATPTGVEFKTRVKAEADGNANGATILGMQMGVSKIMEKGGVLYSKSRLEQLRKGLTHAEIDEIEDDIRDEVFRHMKALPELEKDISTKMDAIFNRIQAKGKVKELMKQPIMTSIYGKDPRYHGDTARKFIQDNPELFSAFADDITKAEKLLTKHLEHALITGLGGALEHAAIMKRVGRAFNFANRIAEIEGPNGFYSQAGGHEYINDTPQPTIFDYIEEGMTDDKGNVIRSRIKITTKQRVPSAQAMASGVKLDTGLKSITDNGSKLRNQIAVNSTQNIDSSVAQNTAIDILSEDPDATFMQIYDAFMGDAASFGKIRRQANKNFIEINKNYVLVLKELEAFQQLRRDIAKDVAKKMQSGENYDIGLEGDYRSLGDFVFNGSRIAMRDMPEGEGKDQALTSLKAKMMRGIAKRNGIDLPTGRRTDPKDFEEMKRVIIPPKLYLELINYAFKTLNIERDLTNFLKKVEEQRKIVFQQMLREGQYS